jgi:two-component system chemotaxis response regulator CheB
MRPRRIVICDDSATYAAALKKFLEHEPGIEVVGVFATAEELLAHLEGLNPDLITMDLEMPGMGGERGIEEIMHARPVPILVLSAYAGERSVRAAEALAAGALEAMPKTGLRLGKPDDVWATAMRSRVKRLASIQLKRRASDGGERRSPPRGWLKPRSVRVIGIGASTGGPPALLAVLRELPDEFELPVLVVQHIGSGFTEGLVAWLDSRIALPVRVAPAGATAGRGVWVAPDEAHLRLTHSMRLSIDPEPRDTLHRPSLDVLFQSLGAVAGPDAVGVVLTGMGRDGAEGVGTLRASGGLVIAQDEASSAVFGMPQAAIASGADVVLPLEEVGTALRTLSTGSAA